MEHIKRVGRTLKHKGSILSFYEDDIMTPDGNVAKWDFIEHSGAAAVIPVLDDGRILLVRQFRNALDRETLEIPAGGINKGEEAYAAAMRELEEETGYKTDRLTHLVSLVTAVAFCNEIIEVYTAKNLCKTQQHLDEDEFIDVESQYTDLLYDYAVIKDKVEGKEGQLVLCAAMEREFLKPYIDLFDEMGISLESIDIMTNSIIKLTESILKLTNLSYVLTVINGQDVIHYLFINGQYEIANRTRIFSDRGTVAFITELSNSLTKLMQFTKGAYKDAQLEKIYFAGLETYEEDMLMSTISSNLSIETSRFKPTNYTCSKDNNFPIHKYLFVGSLWRR